MGISRTISPPQTNPLPNEIYHLTRQKLFKEKISSEIKLGANRNIYHFQGRPLGVVGEYRIKSSPIVNLGLLGAIGVDDDVDLFDGAGLIASVQSVDEPLPAGN